ncbi:MAG: AAA family ATPase, partial [Planctomycetaceae bacterium]
GAGPRAGQYLIAGARAVAAMDGRPSITVKDVRRIAVPVLRHRLSTNFQAQAENMRSEDVIERLLVEVPEPTIPKYERG